MEGYSFGNYSRFASSLFYGTSSGNNQLSGLDREYDISEGWHTYQMRWINVNDNIRVTIYVDGKWKTTYGENAHRSLNLDKFGGHSVILNLNVGSTWGIFNNNNINLFTNTYMYVDWVSVRRRTI